MTGVALVAMVLAALEGRPCETIDVAAATQGLVIPSDTTVRLECDAGQSRLRVARPRSVPVVRVLRLEGADAAVLRVLIEETLAVPPASEVTSAPQWEAGLGPSTVVSAGVALGAGGWVARRLGDAWLLRATVAGGGWAESVELGRLAWQHLDVAVGFARALNGGPVQLRLGVVMRSGLVMGHGSASGPDVQARTATGGFGGVGASVDVMLPLGERWFLSARAEPGLSVVGSVVSAGDVRRGFARWWLVSAVATGWRW